MICIHSCPRESHENESEYAREFLTNILTHFSLLILTPFWGCKSCSAHEDEVHPHEILVNIHIHPHENSHENESEYSWEFLTNHHGPFCTTPLGPILNGANMGFHRFRIVQNPCFAHSDLAKYGFWRIPPKNLKVTWSDSSEPCSAHDGDDHVLEF